MSEPLSLPQRTLSTRHLLGIDGLSVDDVKLILESAVVFDEINAPPLKKVPFLRGRTVASLFFEPSTRTQLSFDLAAKRLSADTASLSVASSSVKKGETLLDTGRNVNAMRPDLVVVRHSQAGAPLLLSRVIDGAVINAGDVAH